MKKLKKYIIRVAYYSLMLLFSIFPVYKIRAYLSTAYRLLNL